VDWFGAVERNYSIPSEPSIQVIISPLAPDHGDLASSKSVIDNQRKTIKVGIGQLPVIRIGSLWKNGELLADQAGKAALFNGLQISPQTVQLIRSNHKINSDWLIPPGYHSVGGDGLKAHCLAVEYKGDPFGLIIPAAEAIRFYYAHSTDLAHAVFAGDFQDNPSSIVMLEDSYFDKDEKTCQLRLRTNFDDEDAWTIGRIFNSPIAKNGAMMIHNSLMRDSINEVFPLYPEGAFPFHAKTSIRARVKPIKSCGTWRYLVFALERCSGPFPFDHLIVDRENRNIKVAGDTNERELKPYPRPPKEIDQEFSKKEIQNRNEPSRYSPLKRIITSQDQFGAVAGIRYEKFIPSENKYKGVRMLDVVEMPIEQYGTGEGVYSENKTGSVRFITDQEVRPLPENLVRFTKAIEKLNKIEGCSSAIRTPSRATQFVPLTKPSRFRQWSYLNSAENMRRQVIVADVLIDGRPISMVEFEWRIGEAYKLALLVGDGVSYLSDGIIGQTLMEMAKVEGRWRKISVSNQLKLATILHGWSSERLYSEITALLIHHRD